MVTTAAVAALNSEGGFMKQFVAIRPWADEIIQGWRKVWKSGGGRVVIYGSNLPPPPHGGLKGLKYRPSEKATKFYEISTVDLPGTT